jgi:hypothetical protein
MLKLNVQEVWPDLLAHELGHAAGYVGDAPGDEDHSIDPFNLMHRGTENHRAPD